MAGHHLPSTAAMQCFEAAARHMSFTRAAEELNITQSAVSKQVAQLESHLQHRLFRRVRRSLLLTPEGSMYLTEVRKILSHIEMSTNYLMSYDGQSEALKIATLPTFGARWLVEKLSAFQERYPQINLDFYEKVEAFDLQKEGIDIAFFYGHGSWPNLESEKLFDENVIAISSPDYLAANSLSSAMELASCRLLHLSTRPAAWHQWFAAQNIATDRSYHGTRFETFHMLIRAVMFGSGVGLVPRFLVEEELASGRLVIAWPFSLTSSNAYYLVYPEELGELPKVRRFADYLMLHTEQG